MSPLFEELDYRETPLGELILRRRAEPRLGGREVYEVKLGEYFLMSSLFTAGETALADLALREVETENADVVVGGLGLGYTARAVLAHAAVRSLLVIEALPAVLDWHRGGLVPLGARLSEDPRCRLIEGDFFARVASLEPGLDAARPGRRFDAVLVDIDHSPRHVLNSRNAAFYEPGGLRRAAGHLTPGGIFGLWSNDPPDEAFVAALRAAFASAEARVVSFDNPYTGAESTSTVYLARPA